MQDQKDDIGTGVPVSAGLAGCGAIAPVHVDALLELKHVRLSGLADPDQAAAERQRQLWLAGRTGQTGQQPVYRQSLDALLTAVPLDVVHICTPHHTHVPLAVTALRHGCHVLLEKPPAISLEGLGQLSQAAGVSGRTLGVCFQNRYNPASRLARQLIQSGTVGPVRTARAFVTWQRDAAYYRQAAWRGRWETEGGGVMINQAIHTLDLLFWLAGRPQSVEGTIANRHLQGVIEVEDTAEMYLTLTGGIHALFYATTAYGSDAPIMLELDCTDLRLRLEGDSLVVLDASGRPVSASQMESLLRSVQSDDSGTDWPAGTVDDALSGKPCWGQGHKRLVRAFYNSLIPGATSFPIDLDSGGLALKALLALYESDRTGGPVRIGHT